MSLDKISPLSPTYPVKKLDKIIREDQQADKNNHKREEKKQDEEKYPDKSINHHIDEIV
jgi:3-methyladenine DNA glycosylase AlkC